jgi:P2-related tail formation protein
LEHEAKQQGNGYQQYFKWEIKGIQPGAETATVLTILSVISKKDALLIHYHVMR